MKNIVSKCVFLLVFSMCVSAVSATDLLVVMNVPFSFVAGSTVLPAGEYKVIQDSNGRFVQVTNVGTHQSIIVVPEARLPIETAAHSGVNFVKIGEQYHLKVVRIAGAQGFLMRTSAVR